MTSFRISQSSSMADPGEQPLISARWLWVILGVPIVAFALASAPYQSSVSGLPLDRIVLGAAGLMLRVIPTLLAMAICSSVILKYLDATCVSHHWPHTSLGGFSLAMFSGLVMPACDCVAVPIFTTLVRRGVPLAFGVTILTAAPLINPVTILSTWAAFPNRPVVVLLRLLTGACVGITAGLIFSRRRWNDQNIPMIRGKQAPKANGEPALLPQTPTDVSRCLAHALTTTETNGAEGAGHFPKSPFARLSDILVHAYDDFIKLMPVTFVGALVSSAVSVMGRGWIASIMGRNPILVILLMTLIAMVCGFCSSADAMLLASLRGLLPSYAIIAFLTVGPIVNIRNTMLMLGNWRLGFVSRYLLSILSLSMVVSLGLYLLGTML